MRNTKRISKIMLGIFALSSFAATTTLADDYMYVKAAHLNVRSAGTVKSKVIAVVDNGYRVTVLENNGKWKKVLLENGQIGYVNGGYLVDSEPAYEKVTSSRYTVKSGSAFLRGFDLNRKVAVLNAGDVLEVTSEKIYLNRWIQVRVIDAKHPRYNDRVGYIAKRLATPIDGYVAQQEMTQETTAAQETSMEAAPVTPVVQDTIVEAPKTTPVTESAPAAEDTTATDADSADAEIEALLKGL